MHLDMWKTSKVDRVCKASKKLSFTPLPRFQSSVKSSRIQVFRAEVPGCGEGKWRWRSQLRVSPISGHFDLYQEDLLGQPDKPVPTPGLDGCFECARVSGCFSHRTKPCLSVELELKPGSWGAERKRTPISTSSVFTYHFVQLRTCYNYSQKVAKQS